MGLLQLLLKTHLARAMKPLRRIYVCLARVMKPSRRVYTCMLVCTDLVLELSHSKRKGYGGVVDVSHWFISPGLDLFPSHTRCCRDEGFIAREQISHATHHAGYPLLLCFPPHVVDRSNRTWIRRGNIYMWQEARGADLRKPHTSDLLCSPSTKLNHEKHLSYYA